MLERGKVIAEGTHDTLMVQSKEYQDLVKHQMEGENDK
jgi:ABC-type multidrug transport system fused ATPase/permease subunit